MKTFLILFAISISLASAEVKYLWFATEAEAEAKELELRGATKCVNVSTKTTRYADVIVNKDGSALLPIKPVYNHQTAQVVDVEVTVLTAPDKSALLTRDNKTVTDSIDKDIKTK